MAVSTQVENLRWWGHLLFWLSVILPFLGVLAGVGRFYVDRAEKAISSATAKADLQASKQELANLKKATAPRHLSAEGKAAIEHALKTVPPANITIMSCVFDDECSTFADEIGRAFEEHKWKVARNKSFLGDFRGFAFGHVVSEQEAATGKNGAVTTQRFLEAAGFKLEPGVIRENSFGGALDPGIVLVVGKR